VGARISFSPARSRRLDQPSEAVAGRTGVARPTPQGPVGYLFLLQTIDERLHQVHVEPSAPALLHQRTLQISSSKASATGHRGCPPHEFMARTVEVVA
jgi:hypothetical protein